MPATIGCQTLKDATNEAMRHWISNHTDTHYIIGSVVGPHPYPDMVARFQSIISAETISQLLQQTGRATPDFVLACVGGGSNAAGAFYHYLDEPGVRLIAAEAAGHGVDTGHSAATTALGKPYLDANRGWPGHRAVLHLGGPRLPRHRAAARAAFRYRAGRVYVDYG